MSADDDKYPPESGRRRFVKGVVGGAALAGVGVTGSVTINSATTAPGAGGGATEAIAIELVDGPAPRGMPQIPVTIEDGYVKGVWPEVQEENVGGRTVKIAREELGGKTYSQEWFQYCGVESYEGLRPEWESDNFFLSDSSPAYQWQADALSEGDRIPVSEFDDYDEWGNGIGQSGLGKPATGTWRSQGAEDTIPIQIIRSPLVEQLANGEMDGVPQDIVDWADASTEQGFIAWLNKCTHFCCVPGYKQDEASAKFDGEDNVYCPCHQSVYDPFTLVTTLFTARPRPDD